MSIPWALIESGKIPRAFYRDEDDEFGPFVAEVPRHTPEYLRILNQLEIPIPLDLRK